ncbi:MAG: hypothetical protein AAGF47_07335 [Planctomycetota bacterium]
MTSRISRPRCLVAALAICGLGLVAQGCNIVAPILFLVVGPDKIPAQHRLDDERTTVILVEDPRNLMPRRAARIALLEAAEDRSSTAAWSIRSSAARARCGWPMPTRPIRA